MDETKNPKCGAKTRQATSNATCLRPAGWGTDHVGFLFCKLHGGNTKNQKSAAAKLKADREAKTLLANLDVAPVDDPLTALSHLAGQIVAWQNAISVLVNRLGDDVRYEGATGAEQLRAEIGMYERAMDRAGKVLADIARLDIDARLTRIEEEKARILIEAVQAGLSAINATPDQAATVKKVMARHLRAVQ